MASTRTNHPVRTEPIPDSAHVIRRVDANGRYVLVGTHDAQAGDVVVLQDGKVNQCRGDGHMVSLAHLWQAIERDESVWAECARILPDEVGANGLVHNYARTSWAYNNGLFRIMIALATIPAYAANSAVHFTPRTFTWTVTHDGLFTAVLPLAQIFSPPPLRCDPNPAYVTDSQGADLYIPWPQPPQPETVVEWVAGRSAR